MKYFTLSEVLRSVPLTFLVGVVFALLKNLLSEFVLCILGIFDLKSFILSKISGNTYKFGAETKFNKANRIISDIYEFFFYIIFGLAFLILNYVLADGIPRLYILILFIACYAASRKLFYKPISIISIFFSCVVKRALFFVVYLLSYIPLRIIIKIRNNTKVKNNCQNSLTNI